jgi:hypothetical protein
VKNIKIAITLIFVAAVVAALARETLGYPPLLVKAKKFGAKDCTFCHVDPDGGPPWNERGQWLIKEKERRGAETVDVEWLANYKPSKPDVTKPAEQAPKEERKASGKVDPKSFDDFVGEYEAPIGVLTITHEGDKLFGQPKGESKEELIPQEDGSFQVTNVEAKVVFNRDASGKVVEVVISLGGQEMKGKKIK